ncbi:DUF2461 domain-containing protein, partial [candidate division KSB1 bacterium]
MTLNGHFSGELFQFLEELKQNNNRDWFQANKGRYEDDVKKPWQSFILEFGPKLSEINPNFVADPSPVGGSMFRIYRDVRFAKDKSPYKTASSAHFRHEVAKNVHAPGFYLHLEPGNVLAGCGIWRPDNRSLAKIRDAIVENDKGWKRVINGKPFSRTYS